MKYYLDTNSLPVGMGIEMVNWCLQTIGPWGIGWTYDFDTHRLYIDDKYVSWFILKWTQNN